MTTAEAILIKQQRRLLLDNLNGFDPSPVECRSLYRTACSDPRYTKAFFEKDIYYFVRKGWLEFRGGPLASDEFSKKLVRLTARGKEIAEQTMTDEALEI